MQAALQTDDGSGSGWGNVFSRKSHLLGSRDSPSSAHDSPQLPWWDQGAGSGGGSSSASAAAAGGIDGTASLSELQLYNNTDGQPLLLGRGGFGQASPCTRQ